MMYLDIESVMGAWERVGRQTEIIEYFVFKNQSSGEAGIERQKQ